MKKTLALLLALALVFSSITVAFAEETISADAKAVSGLGMLVGSGDGVTSAYLATTPNRIQAAIMVLRLKGLEEAAKAFTGVDNFADAKDAAWAAPIMAYLKAHPEVGFGGIGNDKFNPNGLMDVKSYYKVMLETLGYKQNTTEVIGDFTFPNVLDFAAKQGLTKVATVTNFTVDNLATATIEALKAKINGSEKTLATSLIEAKVITEAAAVAAGVYNPIPVDLKVVSVKADNLKQLVVTFNKELKNSGDKDNYKLETDGAAVMPTADSAFALQADKKTVVITLTHESAQQEEVQLTIDGIEAADGSKLAKTVVEDIELFDKTIPEAVSAKVVGNDTIKVTFSEPMNAANIDEQDFTVDDGEIIVQHVTFSNSNTEANVELYSTLEEGKVKIEVGTGAKDYAGFAAPKKSFELNVVKDETAPVVVGYEDATPAGVTLIFNEDIQLVDGNDLNFYHTNSANMVDADVVAGDIDGNKLELSFNNHKLPEGTAYIYILKEAISDLWDNENAKISYKIEVTLDTTKPTVTKIEAGTTERELVITYSEDMDATGTAEDEDNYTILDKDGKEKTNVILDASLTDTDEVTLTFTEDMTGDYSVVIDGVEDKAGNAIVKVTKAFNISDVTAPEFTDFTAKLYKPAQAKQMLKVSFGEAMAVTGKYSVLDLEKYEFNGTNLSDVKNATIKAVDGNKAVEILLPSRVDDATDGVDFVVAQDLIIARVADAANNPTESLASDATDILVSAAGIVAIDETSDYSPRLTAKDTVVVTLLDRLTKFEASDFILKSHGVTLTPSRVRHTINGDGMSTVTFTLANAVNTDATTTATGYDITIDTAAVTASTNVYGEKLVAGDSVTLIDKAKPTLVSATFHEGAKAADGTVITPSTIVLKFSEALRASTFAASGKNGFSVSGGTLSSAALTAPDEVTLTSTSSFFTVNTNVYYNSIAGIKDNKNSNTMADFSETDKLDLP